MNRTWTTLIGAVAATAGIIVAASMAVSYGDSALDQAHAAAATTDQTTLTEGLRQAGITVNVVGQADAAQTKLALDVVTQDFSGLLTSDSNPNVSVVFYSDSTYGKSDPDSTTPTVSPYYTDQKALMVVYPHQIMSPSQPQGVDLPQNLRLEATLVAFVDPLTGDILEGTTFTETGKPL